MEESKPGCNFRHVVVAIRVKNSWVTLMDLKTPVQVSGPGPITGYDLEVRVLDPQTGEPETLFIVNDHSVCFYPAVIVMTGDVLVRNVELLKTYCQCSPQYKPGSKIYRAFHGKPVNWSGDFGQVSLFF